MVEAQAFRHTSLSGLRAATSGRKVAGRRGKHAVCSRSRSGNPASHQRISAFTGRTVAAKTIGCDPIGRGQMAHGRTKRDAIDTTDCRFVTNYRAATTAQLGATDISVASATSLNPFASHGALHRTPARRRPLVGARRRGALYYGYQENAGGCHPPGRDPDCRHSR